MVMHSVVLMMGKLIFLGLNLQGTCYGIRAASTLMMQMHVHAAGWVCKQSPWSKTIKPQCNAVTFNSLSP